MSTNLYGDDLTRARGGYGAEIAGQRMDALDRAALEHALSLGGGVALDLGCGEGIQALRFATLGLETLAIDARPREATLFGEGPFERVLPVRYLSADARRLTPSLLPERVDLAYSQRFIHHLRFEEALALLRALRAVMTAGAKLYLSASGLGSELADGYAAAALPLGRRYAELAPEVRARHRIEGPVCLYRPPELRGLGEAAGLTPERVFRSDFGNVKAVFVAPLG